ncbi:phosphatidylinositol transfer protein beta isoform-like isoform X2 [Tubulanus polymorphus]|uniref:phosphatidylinositol transfer protein beta isoform-like isoform X2 n=1 Tax=Tubulanus polymorphus TaxID=672921 RepID=UPI003DA5F227
MKIIEFRVRLPMKVEEYQVAQLYSVAEASKAETGGGDGIEVLANHPIKEQPVPALMDGYTEGQYTHKIYHIENKIPSFLRKCSQKICGKGCFSFHEKAWNAYPYCRTVVTNEYMKDSFFLKIETLHKDDDGSSENVHNLTQEQLLNRKVVYVDIANDEVRPSDYKEDEDPTIYTSEKTGRGPLKGKDWHKSVTPLMCAYKLVTYEFKWFGIGGTVERFIEGAEGRLFLNFHRQLFCWTDKWYGLTMEDIRAIEDKTQQELDESRQKPGLKGTLEN